MHELEKIATAVGHIIGAGRRGLLVTVAGTRGSTYRRAGARCVIDQDGNITGAISGGCLERDLAERARKWEDGFEARLLSYDSTDFDDVIFGLGLGCRGTIDVVVQLFDASHPPRLPQMPQREPLTFATVVASENRDYRVGDAFPTPQELSVTKTTRLTIDACDVLVEVIRPQRSLAVFGGGSDTEPVAVLAQNLGWRVEVISVKSCHPDDVAAKMDLSRFDAAVIMTHNFLYDLSLLEAVMPSSIPYVGLLGPKSRGEELIERMKNFTPEMRQRLHTPIGLDLGADSPEEIALAIVAEIQGVFSGRSTGSLREKSGPIHEPASR